MLSTTSRCICIGIESISSICILTQVFLMRKRYLTPTDSKPRIEKGKYSAQYKKSSQQKLYLVVLHRTHFYLHGDQKLLYSHGEMIEKPVLWLMFRFDNSSPLWKKRRIYIDRFDWVVVIKIWKTGAGWYTHSMRNKKDYLTLDQFNERITQYIADTDTLLAQDLKTSRNAITH